MNHYRFIYCAFDTSDVESSDRSGRFDSEEEASAWFKAAFPLWRLVRVEQIP